MQLRLDKVAEILGSPYPASDRVALGYSIDSRRIESGQLFFAIRGRRFDGHAFVPDVLARGAAGAVVDKEFWKSSSPEVRESLISVGDTTEALQRLAREVRRLWGKRVIAITGSMGKTTAKEMIAALLASRFSVHKSQGNLNNYYGLPLTLLDLEASHQVAVVELAMSARGEIARLAAIAEPDIGVVTNVAPAHLQFFDSVDSIAKAKRELIENLNARPENAIAVLNFDDRRVRGFADGFDGSVVTFGLGDGAMFRATKVQSRAGGGSSFQVKGPNMEAEFELPLPGIHNIENALAALAAVSVFEVPAPSLQQTLSDFRNLSQRGEILTLAGNILVFNDCYNSNPRAMERMLEMLAGWDGAKRRIVVAGEMLELGPTSPELHRKVGRKLAGTGIDRLIAVQGNARFFVEGALDAGLNAGQAVFFPDASAAGKYCQTLLRAGDVVLVKGSRGVSLERVIELLRSSMRARSGVRSEIPGRLVL
ncbi:MAG: UDP-N-acetylmuramoyl-tripeptide--D-alanyl-D-alanine ligase [Acidobacteria bacterium]|nr:UDP-N-acetylmuramoyl-tripeptide--D-alanyl-D-alanine ligase [Acidobacteriota bacterium]